MYFFLLPILTKGIKAKLNEIESESDIFPLETKKMNYYIPHYNFPIVYCINL